MPSMDELLSAGRFVDVVPIDVGWSNDRKYRVTTVDGERFFLRVSPLDRLAERTRLAESMHEVIAAGVPMSVPVETWTADGVYQLQTWVDGDTLDVVLPTLPEAERHKLGLRAGELLRRIHTVPAANVVEEWAPRFSAKIDRKVAAYRDSGITFDGDEHMLACIEANRHLLVRRPQCFQHGDFHPANLMYAEGDVVVIDFDRTDVGDPWEEFNRIVWSAAISPAFATGQVQGYFDAEPPDEFFRLLALYVATNAVGSIPWAVSYGQKEIDTLLDQAQAVLSWYQDMHDLVPSWYGVTPMPAGPGPAARSR